MLDHSIIIRPSQPADQEKALILANKLNIPLVEQWSGTGVMLEVTEGILTASFTSNGTKKRILIDFTSKKQQYRQQHISKQKELIARAIGYSAQKQLHVVDATAGMGTDSLIMAHLNCKLTIFERNPLAHALLENAIERATFLADSSINIPSMQLIEADFCDYDWNLIGKPAHVVYLDPMFPERKKSALVKKEMQWLQIITEDTPINEQLLLETAFRRASNRVVVKRPIKAEYLNAQSPSHSISGKNIRFDVYMI